MRRTQADLRAGGRRLVALGLLVATIAAGLGIHEFAPQHTVTDAAGDALYALAAYLLVVLLAPRLRPLVVTAIAGAWCVAVELVQLTGLPERLGAAFPPATLVFGTVFDPRDLVIYVVAVALAAGVDALVLHQVARPPRALR